MRKKSSDEIKQELLDHLNGVPHAGDGVGILWAESKTYINRHYVEMGGGFASWGDNIKVLVRQDWDETNEELVRFGIELEEINPK